VTDTIFARSSGAPPAAIAVVRISGPAAVPALRQLAGEPPPPRVMSLRNIVNPADATLLDRALVVHFPGAGSVTGEELVELHLHGGRAVVEAVEAALAALPGLRRAAAGEFTWRAFRNGRLDLIEVESLSDLLRAETEGQRRAAIAGAGLSASVETLRRDVLLLSALAEAALDQSDEDDVPADDGRARALAAALVAALDRLLARPAAERLFDGVRVVFAGPPNAGKSTLINCLAQRDVAIVSPVAGTTRDVIEAPVRLGGVAFVLTDTAGLRQGGSDAIEAIGIARAEARIAAADIVVWMGESPPPPHVPGGRLLAIAARADLRPDAPDGRLRVSATTGEGVAALIEALLDRARGLLPQEDDAALTRRQRSHLAQCRAELLDLFAEPDELLRAERLRRARTALDELTGRAGTEEMLDALFGTFCIGK
jgi:tRNA modification GTPase